MILLPCDEGIFLKIIRQKYLRTAEEEREIFSNLSQHILYDPITGDMFWNKKIGTKIKSGSIAGCDYNGYIRIFYKKKTVNAHRLAWFIFYSEIPNGAIDHIDGDKTNNSIKNLRVVSDQENQSNRPEHRNGVLWGTTKLKKYYQSRVCGKYLGNFKSMIEAHNCSVKYAKDNNINYLGGK